MTTAKTIVAGAAALILTGSALAQQMQTGTVTRIDRLNGTIAIAPVQSGTVGANTGGTAEPFKAQDAKWLDSLHAGDRVSFSATEADGARTITKLERQ